MTTKDTEKSTTPRDPGRGRGNLERDCFIVVRDVLAGDLALPEGVTHLTPHIVGRLIKERDGLDKAPSTGAVAANFVRWGDYGVVNLLPKPVAVKAFTSAFVKAGGDVDALAAFKAKHREKLSKARADARPADTTPAPAKKAAAKKAPAKKASTAKKPAKKAAAPKAS
jgi:hypothetical protein